MKNILKNKVLKIFLLVIACFAVTSVNAETVANSLKMTYSSLGSTPVSFPATFHVKKTTGGKYVYCAHYAKRPPVSSITYTKGSIVSDNGINYLMKRAYSETNSDSDFFVYQTALWVYMIDKGLMPSPYYDLTVFKSTVNNSSSATATKIRNLVSKAKSASATDSSAPTISTSTDGVKFTLSSDGNTYTSSAINVTSSTGSYQVSLTSAPSGTTYSVKDGKLYISVPKSSVTSLSTKVAYKVTNSKDVYSAYYYTPSNSAYQKMIVPYKTTSTASATGELTLTTTASVKISKQDITNSEEVAGATLVIKNSEGKEVVKWTSSTKPYIIKGLSAGTYTLTETIAPEGYKLSSETITFKIGTDGKVYNADGTAVSQITMYNQKKTTTGGVSISKQDATTSTELPGATLVLKKYDGTVVDTWVSTTTPHVIENLQAGIYTLTETIAPSGYILSTETVTFTVKDDGSVTKVVMYNSPNTKDKTTNTEVPVESTGSYKTITSTVIGSAIVLAGGVVLFKTSRKKKND